VAAVVVTHMLPDRPYFLDGLARLVVVGAVLPKPRSCDGPTLEAVSARRGFAAERRVDHDILARL
jgi:adenosylhomocysteinase